MEILSVEDAAARLGVSAKTIRNMIDRGSIPGAYKLDPNAKNSPYRIPTESITKIISQRAGSNEPL